MFSKSNFAKVMRIAILKIHILKITVKFICIYRELVKSLPLPNTNPVRIDLVRVEEDDLNIYYQSKTRDYGKSLLFVSHYLFNGWENKWASIVSVDSISPKFSYEIPYDQF